MAALFEAVRQVVEHAILGNWVEMGTSIVNIVANALQIPINLATFVLRLLGIV